MNSHTLVINKLFIKHREKLSKKGYQMRNPENAQSMRPLKTDFRPTYESNDKYNKFALHQAVIRQEALEIKEEQFQQNILTQLPRSYPLKHPLPLQH